MFTSFIAYALSAYVIIKKNIVEFLIVISALIATVLVAEDAPSVFACITACPILIILYREIRHDH